MTWGGRKAQAWVAAVLAEYGTTCHLCHHGGADSADHLVPRSHPTLGRALQFVVSNGRPVHHKPCPACRRTCNITRSAGAVPTAPRTDARSFFERTP
jgi:hypothetical protein